MTIHEFLQSRGVSHRTLLHRPSPTSTHRARSVHVSGSRVAKAVLIRAGSGFVLAVLPATHRINFDQLAGVLQTTGLGLASEDELERVFSDCERGAIPPFGSVYGLTTVIDVSLAEGGEIVIEGNARHEDLTIKLGDFEAIEAPVHGTFADVMATRTRRPSHRRAS